MWLLFGEKKNNNYILCKGYTTHSRIELSILIDLFNKNLNIYNLQKLLNIKRPIRICEFNLGLLIQTIDSDYPEFIITKYNLNIFKIIIQKPNDFNHYYKLRDYIRRYVEFDTFFISNIII